MATHRYDPYLWVHLAGIATVPLWLAICALGLAVGSPQWPSVELALLTLLGGSPVLWMQLGRPFYIFSLLALTLKPTALSDDQRRMLTLFQQWWVRGLAIAAPLPLVWLLWEIYPRAVVASDITPFAPWGRLGGLAVAAGSFAMANLFLQVPVSVLAVLATSDKRFKRTAPYSLDEIKAHFTKVGIPLNRLLPEVLPPDGAISAGQDSTAQEALVQDALGRDPAQQNQEVTEAELTDSEVETTLNLPQEIALETTMEDVQVQAEVLQAQADHPEIWDQQEDMAQSVGAAEMAAALWDSEERGDSLTSNAETETSADAEAKAEVGIEATDVDVEALDVDNEVIGHITLDALAEGDALESQELSGAEIETSETTVEVLEDVAETSVSDLGGVAEDSVAESPVSETWDHAGEGWDQTNRDWDQDKNWEVSTDSSKETIVEVAVVRISDPS